MPSGAAVVRYEGKRGVVWRIKYADAARQQVMETLGRESDDAVVAAVMQWTFSPATKRGEPVNCWYNIGVPLGHAD